MVKGLTAVANYRSKGDLRPIAFAKAFPNHTFKSSTFDDHNRIFNRMDEALETKCLEKPGVQGPLWSAVVNAVKKQSPMQLAPEQGIKSEPN